MEIKFKGMTPTLQKLDENLKKRHLTLNFQSFYCIKKRKTTSYPNCKEAKYETREIEINDNS
jgi:hypothetical protein